MRKIYSAVIPIIIIMALMASCSNGANKSSEKSDKITEPEQIEGQVFNILKNADFKSEDGEKLFAKNFLSYQEMLDLAEDDRVTKDPDVRLSFTSMTEEEWTESINQIYKDMLSRTLIPDFYWSNIEYKYFTYHLGNDNGGGKFVEGLLSISQKNKEYEFDTYSIWNGEEYVLILFAEHKVKVEKDKAAGGNMGENAIDPEKEAMVEQIGQDVFEMLKALNVTDEKAFMKNILTLEELNELGESDRVTTDPAMKDKFLVAPEEYKDFYSSIYGEMKSMGIENGIVWEDIEYYNYAYKVIYDKGGGEFITSLIAFNYKDKLHKVDIYSFWDGEKYMLLRFGE